MILNIFHSGGLWAIPLALAIAAIYCLYRGLKIHNSGQQAQNQDPNSKDFGKWTDVPGKYPLYKIGAFVFGVVLAAAAIVSFLVISSDYKGV